MEKHLKGHDVLQLKVELMDRVTQDAIIRYMDGFITGKGYKSMEVGYLDGEALNLSVGAAWCLSEYQTLKMADSYLIGAQMNALIRQAAADVPDDLMFEPHIVPSQYGFLVFEDPWKTVDVNGKNLLTRVVTWQPVQDKRGKMGVQIAEYSAISDRDEVSEALRLSATPQEFRDFVKVVGDLQVQHLIQLQFGSPVLSGIDPNWDEERLRASVGPVKAMVALFLLMQQRVTETVVSVPSQPKVIRRWERKNVKPAVNVINLRRRQTVSETAAQHESGGQREWSGRWMVKGHWRNQPFGPGRQDRHWIYIHPYLKGPDDKPIIDRRPRVYKLSR